MLSETKIQKEQHYVFLQVQFNTDQEKKGMF